MTIIDAIKVLQLGNILDPDTTKKAYRKAARKYHPDVNPAGEQMMKLINAAFDLLKNTIGDAGLKQPIRSHENFCGKINDALNAIIRLPNIEIEVCGSWVWVGGNTKPHKEVLKGAGYIWHGKKRSWYFRASDYRSRRKAGTKGMSYIREKYGSIKPKLDHVERLGGIHN